MTKTFTVVYNVAVNTKPINIIFEVKDMAIIIDQTKLSHALSLVSSGHTFKDAGVASGISPETIRKYVIARNITKPKRCHISEHIKNLPHESIVREYVNGLSVLALSKKYKVSRGPISNILKRHGVNRRNQSLASIVSASQMTIEQRKERTKAANNAMRGAKQPRYGRIKRSIGVERTTGYQNMIGIGEELFNKLLTENGVSFVWQKSVDIYSIDFMIGNVAVEMKHRSMGIFVNSDIRRERIKYLRECGLISLYIISDSDEDILINFSYIMSHINRLNRYPSPIGKYWVVRSRIDRFARVRNEKGQFSCVPSTPKPFASCREVYY